MGNHGSLTGGICDFCSNTEPKYAYPTRDFQFGPSVSKAEWHACDICHDLIETDNRAELCDRAVRQIIQDHPEMMGDIQWVRDATRELHEIFLANRITIQKSEVN